MAYVTDDGGSSQPSFFDSLLGSIDRSLQGLKDRSGLFTTPSDGQAGWFDNSVDMAQQYADEEKRKQEEEERQRQAYIDWRTAQMEVPASVEDVKSAVGRLFGAVPQFDAQQALSGYTQSQAAQEFDQLKQSGVDDPLAAMQQAFQQSEDNPVTAKMARRYPMRAAQGFPGGYTPEEQAAHDALVEGTPSAAGVAEPAGNPVTEVLNRGVENMPTNYPGGGLVQNIAGVGANLAGGVADAATLGALSGVGGGNTDVSSPQFWTEAGTAGLNAALLHGGAGPLEEAIASRLGGGATAQLAGKFAGGATIGAGFGGAAQVANGEFDPQALAEQALLGGTLAAGPSAAGLVLRENFGLNPLLNRAQGAPAQEPVVDLPTGPNIVYHGTSGDLNGPLQPGSFVTTDRASAEAFARGASRLNGEPGRVYAFQADPSALQPSSIEGLASSMGAMQVSNPEGLRPVGVSGVQLRPAFGMSTYDVPPEPGAGGAEPTPSSAPPPSEPSIPKAETGSEGGETSSTRFTGQPTPQEQADIAEFERGGNRTPPPQGPTQTAQMLSQVESPLIDLGAPKSGVTVPQKIANGIAGFFGKSPIYDEQVTPAIKDFRTKLDTLRNQGGLVVRKAAALDKAFDLQPDGTFELNGERVYLEDVAREIGEARQLGSTSAYEYELSPKQLQLLNAVVDDFQRLKAQYKAVGLELPSEYQGYLPRGNGTPPEALTEAEVPGKKGFRGNKAGAAKERQFETREEANSAGYTYPSFPDAVQQAWHGMANEIATKHLSDLLLSLQDEQGNPLFVKRTTSMPVRGTGFVPLPGLEGYVAPAEFTNMINRALGINESLLGQGVVTANQAVNQIRTSFDFATPVRLLASGVMHPTQYLRAIPAAIHAMADDSSFGNWIAEHDAQVQQTGEGIPSWQAARDGLRLSSSSHQGPLSFRGHYLSNAPLLSNAQRFFPTFLDRYRLSSYQDALDFASKRGEDITDPGVRQQAANLLNRGTGASARFGGGKLDGLVNFPQWLGSQFDLIGKAVADRSIEGQYARQSLFKLLGGAVALTYAVNYSQGKDTEWQDGQPVMHLGPIKVKPFGPWGTLIKTAMKTSPVSLDSDHELQNPLGGLSYFAESKASPISAVLIDLIKSAQGDTPFDGSMGSWQYWAHQLSPFAVSNVDRDTFKSPAALANAGLEAIGVRSSLDNPTPYQQSQEFIDKAIRTQFADQLAKQAAPGYVYDPNPNSPNFDPNHIAVQPGQKNLTLASLNQEQKAQLKATAAGSQYKTMLDKAIAGFDQQAPGPVDAMIEQMRSAKDAHNQRLQQIEQQYDKTHDGLQLRKAVADENTRYLAITKQFDADAQKIPAGPHQKDPTTGKYSDKLTVSQVLGSNSAADKLVGDYYTIIDKNSHGGVVDWNAVDAQQQAFLNGLSPNARKYVEDRLATLGNKGQVTNSDGTVINLPGMAELQQAKALTGNYWGLRDQVFQQYAPSIPFLQSFDSYSSFKAAVDAEAARQGVPSSTLMDALRARYPRLDAMETKIATVQRNAIHSDKNMAAALQKFYGVVPARQTGLVGLTGLRGLSGLQGLNGGNVANPAEAQLSFAQNYGRDGVVQQGFSNLNLSAGYSYGP